MPLFDSKNNATVNRKKHTFRQKLFFSCSCVGLSLICLSSNTWASVEPLSVSGSKIYAGGKVRSFSGNSLFWSNTGWNAEKFYTAETVASLKKDWKSSIVRAAMGVQEYGGYLQDPTNNKARVEKVVNAAIANDMYVIIDWHSHSAENNRSEAISFFQEMARKYGDKPNVIYEIYNEPLQVSWSYTIKPYAEAVISAIRAIDPDNLIVVGTPSWSQNVDEASRDPINAKNIAYTLHFYAGTHGESLRNKARQAINNGIALFVTEWGSVNADGNGGVNYSETDAWVTFMRDNNISNANWALNDKNEGASTYYPDSKNLTESGKKVKSIIQSWPYKTSNAASAMSESESSSDVSTDMTNDSANAPDSSTTTSCANVNIYPNWVSKDWAGGQPDHNEAGQSIVYKGNLYTANWYTTSVPGSDSSWALVGSCN
ncbi:cellulase family glycosylhydrolase [Dickeya zeae]|uniref:cellulase family glycosylhydrolase n=1 Tax=Dickeya zeae TaxID=204042 RepID=UPI000D76E3F6|nr:cellulase family glycosylhydrolase [Dickeya zeae]PXW47533.1 endoglucanase [Erwinia sp. AG740]UJR54979.1 cellulase family glycosylhydrolase [Dickeya zeae MS1]